MKPNDIDKIISEAQEPVSVCPECGGDPTTTTSFSGRGSYRNKRHTQSCECGWSCIIPTYHEALVQLGLAGQSENQ